MNPADDDYNGHLETGIEVEAVPVAPAQAEWDRAINGDAFILDIPTGIPAVWGRGTQVLWAKGEALMIAGQQGVGKTTLAGQVVAGLLGIGGDVLGLPVADMGCKILYLAMDRPRQIARSLRRQFGPRHREILNERLAVWEGPPPRDLAANPALLAKMAEFYGAGVVIVDSLKDAAVGLSEDAVGAQWNRARQHALAQGVQVLELHHTTKRGPAGTPVSSVADIFGSTWLTSGCGSVIMLTGEPGDPIVKFAHAKQPAEEYGPFMLNHDQAAGQMTIDVTFDLIELVRAAGVDGLTAKDAAVAITDKDKPSRADIEKARRKLDQKVTEGALVRLDGQRGGGDVRSVTAWFLAGPEQSRSNTEQSRGNHAISKTAGRAITRPTGPEGNHAPITGNHAEPKTAGRAITQTITGNHAEGNHENPHHLSGGGGFRVDPAADGTEAVILDFPVGGEYD